MQCRHSAAALVERRPQPQPDRGQSHAGITTDEFSRIIEDWLASARHPRFDRRFNELVFQPMLELLDYLRTSGFKTWIMSGGGSEFLRPWAFAAHGVPPSGIWMRLSTKPIDGAGLSSICSATGSGFTPSIAYRID